MSHMGSWEIAAHLLKLKGFRLLLYLGEKHREQIEQTQKQSLQDLGVKIIAVSPDGGSPFDIVEGIQFLREGGFVSLTGDRLWSEGQRSIAVKFLGHRVELPEAPHIFALLSGVPLFMFFVSRKGDRSYHLIVSEPRYVKTASREALRLQPDHVPVGPRRSTRGDASGADLRVGGRSAQRVGRPWSTSSRRHRPTDCVLCPRSAAGGNDPGLSGDVGAARSLTSTATPPRAGPSARVAFYALSAETDHPPAATCPLYEFIAEDGRRAYATIVYWRSPGFGHAGKPIGLVWRNPLEADVQ